MADLIHWHGSPSKLAQPPDCCKSVLSAVLDKAEREHDRRLAEAVHAERRRVVLEALEAVEAYGEAVASVLDESEATLARTVIAKVADAIRKTGCICPLIEVTSFGGGYETMPGYDSRCGMHDRKAAS